MLTLLARTLGRTGPLLTALAVLLAAFQAALVAIAASLDVNGGVARLASLAPTFMRQALGPALTSFGGMAALGFFEPLIVMLVLQYAVYLATEPAGDVESGLVDLILARPVARHRLVTRSLLVMTGAAIVLPATMAASLWGNLAWLAPPGARWPDAKVICLLAVHLGAVSWCFGGAALAVASFASRRGQAQAIVAVTAVACYLLEAVGEAWTRAAWASWISPFHRFHGAGLLAGETHPVSDLTTLLAIGTVGVVIAYWQFQRRDV